MPTQKARVFVVYFLYLLKYFFKILYEKRKKGSEKKNQYILRMHINIKMSKPTKPAKYGILLYSLNMLQLVYTAG